MWASASTKFKGSSWLAQLGLLHRGCEVASLNLNIMVARNRGESEVLRIA